MSRTAPERVTVGDRRAFPRTCHPALRAKGRAERAKVVTRSGRVRASKPEEQCEVTGISVRPARFERATCRFEGPRSCLTLLSAALLSRDADCRQGLRASDGM